jgi:hypothetical protein
LLPAVSRYHQSHALLVRWEMLIRDPQTIAGAVAGFLDRDLDTAAMAAAIWQRPPEHQGRVMELERWKEDAA